MGVAGGRVAAILGIPEGTTLEQYYAQYGYNPGSGYSGGSRRIGTPEPEEKPTESGTTDEDLRRNGDAGHFVSGVRHRNGKQMTTGFKYWWPQIRADYDNGATIGQMERTLDYLVDHGIILSYERDIIKESLGLN
jgi:hypothetical protein